MNEKINPLAFGYAGAVVGALGMLLLGILGNISGYTGAVSIMQERNMFFSLNVKEKGW